MSSKFTRVVLALFYLSTLCDAQTRSLSTFKRFRSLQLDNCTTVPAKATSKNACARLCVSQVTCTAFSFDRTDSLCSTCFSGNGSMGLTFDDGRDTYLKRQSEKFNFMLNNSTLTRFGLTETIYPGRVFYMRGVFGDSRGFQINAFNDTNSDRVHYRLVTNDTTNCIQINSRFATNWQPQQKLCNYWLVLNGTFEVHLLFKTTEVEMLLVITCILLAALNGVNMAAAVEDNSYQRELTRNYWLDGAHSELERTLQEPNRGVAKNIILFIGDGMGPATVTAGRILAGQKLDKKGEEYSLTFDEFPYTGASKTYAVDEQVTDSAASATAFLCGVKTNRGVLGITAGRPGGQPQHFYFRCKSTGIVTTTRITHATPAGAYAHTPHRDWESDRLIPESEKNCKDIAYQLIKFNSDINVLMGGGRAYFYPENFSDPDPDPKFNVSKVSRTDGVNLVEEWLREKQGKGQFVYNKSSLDEVDFDRTDYLLGKGSTTYYATLLVLVYVNKCTIRLRKGQSTKTRHLNKMGFKIKQLVMSLLYIIALSESKVAIGGIFKKIRDLQMDKCPSIQEKVTSNNACARVCIDQGCYAFSFSNHDSVCRIFRTYYKNTSLTFHDGVDTTLRRRYFDRSNFSLKNNTRSFNLSDGFQSGNVIYLRGRFDDRGGFQISLYNDTDSIFLHYRFATNYSTQSIQISNKLGKNLQLQQEVASPFAMNQTFELHLMIKTTGMVSYVNRTHFNTHVYNNYTCSEVRYLILDGYIYIEELSM
ncbi:hypothetical protein Btru_043244 [Bulinus truncatus]|nr:hypothetical protein Btru_043244 [Bulinus truncatus]